MGRGLTTLTAVVVAMTLGPDAGAAQDRGLLARLSAEPDAPVTATDPAGLEARIRARLGGLDARTSLFARHLPTGREVAVRPDLPMNTLSVIKVPIMLRAFRDAEAGRLDPGARRLVEPGDMRRGSGLLQTFEPGLRPTVRDLVTQMIITSDNTATDMRIDEVGLERVNLLLDSLGLPGTRLKATTGELFRETWIDTDPSHASLGDREVYERGFPSDSGAAERFFALEGDSARWLGRSTARETVELLARLVEGDLAGPESTEAMMGILNRQFYATRLPRFARGVQVAHKTGDWPPYAGNDVGILFYDGGPTAVAVYTNQSRGSFLELERTLGRIAEELVAAWR